MTDKRQGAESVVGGSNQSSGWGRAVMRLLHRRTKRTHFAWKPEYDDLANYNTQRMAGKTNHPPEYVARMAELQEQYNRQTCATYHLPDGSNVAGNCPYCGTHIDGKDRT